MNTHDIEPLQDAADLLRSYLKLCKTLPRGDSYHLGRIERAIAAIEADRKRGGDPVAPEGFRLIAVNEAFDSLTFWLDRCEQKGHLENCADLVEPWEAFEYREVEAPQPAEPCVAPTSDKPASGAQNAIHATQPQQIPEGYKLVPIEPTEEMMRAGCQVPLNKAARHNIVYKAMLEAAPEVNL